MSGLTLSLHVQLGIAIYKLIIIKYFPYLSSRDKISRITADASEISRIIGDSESSNPGMDADTPEVATLCTRRQLFVKMALT